MGTTIKKNLSYDLERIKRQNISYDRRRATARSCTFRAFGHFNRQFGQFFDKPQMMPDYREHCRHQRYPRHNYATVIVIGVSLKKFRPQVWQPTEAIALTLAPCVSETTGAVPVFEIGTVKSCDKGCCLEQSQPP